MSECVCLYGNGDEPNDFQRSETRIARKVYRCGECHREIGVGEKHNYFAGKNDGDFFSERTCLPCHEIQRALYCDGYYFGCLWDDISEQIFAEGKMNSACLDKLQTVEAKQFLQRRWMEWVDKQATNQ